MLFFILQVFSIKNQLNTLADATQLLRTDLNKRSIGLDLDQRLPQHESLYPIGLKSPRIEIPHGGFYYIEFLKTDFH